MSALGRETGQAVLESEVTEEESDCRSKFQWKHDFWSSQYHKMGLHREAQVGIQGHTLANLSVKIMTG